MVDIGLLLMRVAIGLTVLIAHGLPKLNSFEEKQLTFPDPLGVSSPVSLALAIGAEVFCSAALVVGLKTRIILVPLVITMVVAFFLVHGDDPWQKKELSFIYLQFYVALMIAGPGRFSIDQFRRI